MENWLNAKQAAAHLGCTIATLYMLVRKKKIRAVRMTGSRDLRFQKQWIDDWLLKNSTFQEAVNQ